MIVSPSAAMLVMLYASAVDELFSILIVAAPAGAASASSAMRRKTVHSGPFHPVAFSPNPVLFPSSAGAVHPSSGHFVDEEPEYDRRVPDYHKNFT
jgi:hypothetical protein